MDNGQEFYYGSIDSLFSQYKSRHPDSSPQEIINGVKELIRNGYTDIGKLTAVSYKGQKGYYASSNGQPVFVPDTEIKRTWSAEEIKASKDRENGANEISELVERIKRNQEEANKETRLAEKKSIENYQRKNELDSNKAKAERRAKKDFIKAQEEEVENAKKAAFADERKNLREANEAWAIAKEKALAKERAGIDPVEVKQQIREEPKKPSVKDEKNLTGSDAKARKPRKSGKTSSAETKSIEPASASSEGKNIEPAPSSASKVDEANIIKDDNSAKKMPPSADKKERTSTTEGKPASRKFKKKGVSKREMEAIEKSRVLNDRVRRAFAGLKAEFLNEGTKDVRKFSVDGRYGKLSKRYSRIIEYRHVDPRTIVSESKMTGTEQEKYAIRKQNYRTYRIDKFSMTAPVKSLNETFREEFKNTIIRRGVNGKLFTYMRRVWSRKNITDKTKENIRRMVRDVFFKSMERKIELAEKGIQRTESVIKRHSDSLDNKYKHSVEVAEKREIAKKFYKVGDQYDKNNGKKLRKYHRLATVYNNATGKNDKAIVKYKYYGKKAKARKDALARKKISNIFKSISLSEKAGNRNFRHQNFLSRKEKWRNLLMQYWRTGKITPEMESAAKQQYEKQKSLRAKERFDESAENRRKRDIARSRNPNERTLSRRKAYNIERQRIRETERAARTKRYSTIRENAISRIRKMRAFGKKPITQIGAYNLNKKFLTYKNLGGKADIFTPEERNPARNNFRRRSMATMGKLGGIGGHSAYSASFLESNISPGTFNAPTSMYSLSPMRSYGGGIMFVVDEHQLVANLYSRIPQAIVAELKRINPLISKKLLDLIEPYVPKDTGQLYQSARETSSLLASKGVKFGRTAPNSAFTVSISYNTPYAEIVYYDPTKAHGAEYNAKHGGNFRGEKECYRWIEKALNENGAAVDAIKNCYAIAFNKALNSVSGGRKTSSFI